MTNELITVGHNVEKKVEAILESFGLHPRDVGYVMADNAANITKAFSGPDPLLPELYTDTISVLHSDKNSTEDDDCSESEWLGDGQEEEFEDATNDQYEISATIRLKWERLGCCAHLLQLAVNAALKADEEAFELSRAISTVVQVFRRSPFWTEQLKSRCRKTLLQPCITRWNSFLHVAERLIEVCVALNCFLCSSHQFLYVQDDVYEAVDDVLKQRAAQTSKCISLPSSFNKDSIKGLVKCLKPVEEATNILQSNGPTASLVLVTIISSKL